MADIQRLEAGISDIKPAEPPSDLDIVDLANHLLNEFSIDTKFHEVGDIGASFFVILYERLFSDRLPEIVRQPVSKEDEIHNCQIVIDFLSTEVVKDSLSHIRGSDIVAGNRTSILNLLDIFSYLLEYMVKRIEHDRELIDTSSLCPSELEAELSYKGVEEDQGMSALPQRSLGKTASSNTTNNNNRTQSTRKRQPHGDRNDNRKAFDSHEIISHEDFYAMSYGGIPTKNNRAPSPINVDLSSQSLLGQKTINSDFDSILADPDKASGKPKDHHKNETKIAWEAPRKLSREETELPDSIIDGVTLRACTQSAPDSQWETSAYHEERPIPSFSASMPASHTQQGVSRNDPLRSTVGPIQYHTQSTQEKQLFSKNESAKPDPSVKGLSSSYNDLRELVEKTAALTRVALATSPVRTKTAVDLDVTDLSLHTRPRPFISSKGAKLAKELDTKHLKSAANKAGVWEHNKVGIPSKTSKKVAFASLRDSGIHNYDSGDDVLSGWQSYSPTGYTSDIESDYINGESSSPERPRRSASTDSKPKIFKSSRSAANQKKFAPQTNKDEKKFAKYLAKNRQPELGAAHMTLKTQDRAIRRKQDLLKKFYEQDHKEFKEDVEYMLDRDKQKSKELEEERIKKCAPAPVKKKVTKNLKVQMCKKARMSKPACTRSTEKKPLAAPKPLPLNIESEEDLLPALLEEFPHLHLSEDTWHELWRRGVQQIESLTRAHQESQRKKSKAQSQLEDAAERHELLADIMKKQLEHTKRMRDIKEQKQQQITTRNKMHEKRIQSARARRYYNEYQVRTRAKQLKRRTREEMVFRELFKDALSIQKERVRDVRRYANDQRKQHETRRQNEIDSLENFYHDQFEMLADKLSKERIETEVRDAAQQKIMQQLKRDLRKKMESEIEQYQEELFRDDDDVHFRKCDADRVLRQLHQARYSAKI